MNVIKGDLGDIINENKKLNTFYDKANDKIADLQAQNRDLVEFVQDFYGVIIKDNSSVEGYEKLIVKSIELLDKHEGVQ
ncbi:hypothetical protein [Maledivibacter halophilus]|uniref:Uncharacterized protein n=1 Tax=Maledivibacter halophilus TaxID=36842 RepID=A0A1T5KEP0_9FIRM|nr:hypothetical protein [Maledivibacter halophilus]SKC62163.1 hypothetical protein SAMN02194393_01739 [Maledivibacter halophilus]